VTESRQIILVGAGLSNGLLADRLLALKPDLDLLVLEGGDAPGGNHTWCFHDSDVEPTAMAWLAPYVSARWQQHDVAFPSFARTLPGTYNAIRSDDFAKRVSERLGSRLKVRTRVKSVKANSVVLEDGTELQARAVIDGRGGMGDELGCGYQKFVGQELRLTAPHGLARPMLMDASVPQLDG
jgi:lycopene beta-cyclase